MNVIFDFYVFSNGGKKVRYRYPDYQPELPISLKDPYRPIRQKANGGLCFDVKNFQMRPYTDTRAEDGPRFEKFG